MLGGSNKSIITVETSTPLSEMDSPSMQNISKDAVELSNTINQLDIMEIYRLLHPVAAHNTLFSSAYGTFIKIDYILGHKTCLDNFFSFIFIFIYK